MAMKMKDDALAVVVRSFPTQTERFVLRELFALLEAGCNLRIYAMDVYAPEVDDAIAVRIAPHVIKLPSPSSSLAVFSFAAAPTKMSAATTGTFASFILAAPLTGKSQLWRKLRWLRWHLRHSGRALWLAGDLKRCGIRRCHAQFGHMTASIALMAAMSANSQFSFTAHAYDIYVEPIAMRQKVRHASSVITCTQANLEHLRSSYPEGAHKMHLVYHGLLRHEIAGLERCALERNRNEVRHTLLFVGRLVPKKGVDVLLKALALLHRSVKCLIVGDGPMRQKLDMLTAQLNLKDCVTFIGSVKHSEVSRYYASATALVVPSVIANDGDRDGLPNVILEAAAASLPIIASDVSGITEFVEDGKTGLLFHAGDCEGLAEAIKRLLSNDELAIMLSNGARQKLLSSFVAEENAKRLVSLLLQGA